MGAGLLAKRRQRNQGKCTQHKIGSHTASTDKTALTLQMQFVGQLGRGLSKPDMFGHFG